MDGQEPQIHEVWTFGEDGITREVHPIAQVDVGAGFFEKFATDYLTESWRRVPMFGGNSINGSVEWLGVTEFLRTDRPPWTANILATHPSLGERGSSKNTNWSIQYGGHTDSVSVPWNHPVRVYLVYCRRIFENTRSAARLVRGNLLRANHLVSMESPTSCRNPIRNSQVRQDDDWDDLWDEPFDQ